MSVMFNTFNDILNHSGSDLVDVMQNNVISGLSDQEINWNYRIVDILVDNANELQNMYIGGTTSILSKVNYGNTINGIYSNDLKTWETPVLYPSKLITKNQTSGNEVTMNKNIHVRRFQAIILQLQNPSSIPDVDYNVVLKSDEPNGINNIKLTTLGVDETTRRIEVCKGSTRSNFINIPSSNTTGKLLIDNLENLDKPANGFWPIKELVYDALTRPDYSLQTQMGKSYFVDILKDEKEKQICTNFKRNETIVIINRQEVPSYVKREDNILNYGLYFAYINLLPVGVAISSAAKENITKAYIEEKLKELI